MRRLVYLANAVPELFICLLPGSASRECLYIRANTPRVLYARGSRLFKAYLVVLLSGARMRDRFSLSSLTPRPSLDPHPSHLDLSLLLAIFLSSLFRISMFLCRSSLAEAAVQFRGRENENIGEKNDPREAKSCL